MSTVIISAILASTFIVICLLLIGRENKYQRKELESILNKFSKAGSENNLNFSSQEILEHRIIGLDGVKRKLLVYNKENFPRFFLIDLLQVKRCFLKKEYRKSSGKVIDSNMKPGQNPEEIQLCFEFLKQNPTVSIPFYSNKHHPPHLMEEMKCKAEHWEIILSKIINSGVKKTA
jgi:hypothetical protein